MRRASARAVRLLSFLAVAGLAGYLLRLSWLRWGDLVYDVGREMVVPALILQGKVLYRDLFYLYGPLPPYLNALAYALLGIRLVSLHIVGGLLLVAATWLVYRLAREHLSHWNATVTVLVFMAVIPFQCYYFAAIFTYLLPYSFGSLYALVFALGALLAFSRVLTTSRGRYVTLATVGLIGALWSKVEIGLAGVAAVGVALLFLSRRQPGADAHRPKRLAACLVLIPAAALATSMAGMYAVSPPAGRAVLLGLARSSLYLSGGTPPSTFGSDFPLARLLAILSQSALLVVYFLLLAAGSSVLARLTQGRLGRVAVAIAGTVWLGGCLLLYGLAANPLEFFLPVPLILLGTAFRAARGARRDAAARGRWLSLFTLAVAGFLLCLRMLLNVTPSAYGAFLLVPGLLVTAIALLDVLPSMVRPGLARTVMTAGAAALLLLVAAQHLLITRRNFLTAVLEVREPRGTIRLPPERFNEDLRKLISAVRTFTPRGATLVVFPEGLPLNFLTERDNPLYFTNYISMELKQKGVMEAVLAELDRKKPEYIAVVWRLEAEYGPRESFSQGYGMPIADYLAVGYTPVLNLDSAILMRRRHGEEIPSR